MRYADIIQKEYRRYCYIYIDTLPNENTVSAVRLLDK